MVLGDTEDYFYWDGIDSNGITVKPGVYLYRVSGEGMDYKGVVIVAR